MPVSEPVVLSSQDFWTFSLGHYAQAGVQPACLALQEAYQGNVNLALLLHWLDTQHIRLADSDIHALIAGVTSGDTRLQQFRTMRKQLKSQLDPTGYQQLLTFELALEKDQQCALIEQVNLFNPATSQHDNTQVNDNLARYCQQHNAIGLLAQLQAQA